MSDSQHSNFDPLTFPAPPCNVFLSQVHLDHVNVLALRYKDYYSQEPQEVNRRQKFLHNPCDPQGRYSRLFARLPIFKEKDESPQSSNPTVPLTQGQRFVQLVALKQAIHDERTFYMEFFREKFLEETVLFEYHNNQAYSAWVTQHDIDEVESKKQRLKEKARRTDPAWIKYMQDVEKKAYEALEAQSAELAEETAVLRERQEREWAVEQKKTATYISVHAAARSAAAAQSAQAARAPKAVRIATSLPPAQAESSATTNTTARPTTTTLAQAQQQARPPRPAHEIRAELQQKALASMMANGIAPVPRRAFGPRGPSHWELVKMRDEARLTGDKEVSTSSEEETRGSVETSQSSVGRGST